MHIETGLQITQLPHVGRIAVEFAIGHIAYHFAACIDARLGNCHRAHLHRIDLNVIGQSHFYACARLRNTHIFAALQIHTVARFDLLRLHTIHLQCKTLLQLSNRTAVAATRLHGLVQLRTCDRIT